MKLRVKYCGGCNPNINRSQLVQEVISRLKEVTDVELVNDGADIGLIIGGCSVCCVNIFEIEDQAASWIVVGGSLLDQVQVPTHHLPHLICTKILRKGGSKSC
ncbi:hypothetical protein [Syntrophomonas erecta]